MISVIIPTLNDLKVLRALSSLQKQTVNDFEIILVDNAVDPKVKGEIKDFNKNAKVKVCYIAEPKLGLHHARHAGARVAKGDILLFSEDEATFSTNWVENYQQHFLAYPQMVAAGGPISLKWEKKPPSYLKSFIINTKTFSPLGFMKLYDNFHLNKKGSFFGGNMGIRRKILFELGGFNPEVFNNLWLGDGETGLNIKLWQKGLLIGYLPKALVYHNIPKQKMTLKHLLQRMEDTGRCDIYTIFHQNGVPKNLIDFLRITPSLIYVNIRFWVGNLLFKSPQAPIFLKIKMQFKRTSGEIKYIQEIMQDKKLQELISVKSWL